MPQEPKSSAAALSQLRRRAERRTRHLGGSKGSPPTESDTQRLLHELDVHQIELELQNSELRSARDESEAALEKYTDLYDFAPIGYFTISRGGTIQLVNLTGARMLGIERSRLMGRAFVSFVREDRRADFEIFLNEVLAADVKRSCDLLLLTKGQAPLAVNIEAQSLPNQKECRAAVIDITERTRAEESHRRLEVLAASNQKLEREIIRRMAVEKALQKSERYQRQLLFQSKRLARQILNVQEEERIRISRELHDQIAQTLVGINVRLAALRTEAGTHGKDFHQHITSTQQLVEASVDIVHRFARELRPTLLDDLGLIPALHAFLKTFSKQTRILVRITVFAAVEKLDISRRIVLFRVAQEALANVAKHAGADQVVVNIQEISDQVCMTIKDNGKKARVNPWQKARSNKRLGLIGMRERLEMVDGSFKIKTEPGKGTTVWARVPFRHSKKAKSKKFVKGNS